MKFKIKKNIISIFTFFTLLLLPISTTVMINHTLTNQTLMGMERGFFGKSTYSIAVQNEKICIDDLLYYINDDMALYHDYNDNIREFAYKGKFAYFPMISGRFFSQSDFNSSINYAIIGKKQEKNTFQKENKTYINVDGFDYEVIGVFGTNDETMFDNKILVNHAIKKTSQSTVYFIDCFFSDSDKDISAVIEKLQSSGIDAEQISIEKSILSNIIPNMLYSRWFLLLIICDLISVILLSIEWIEIKKKEIAIKLLLGNSALKAMVNTCISYILMVIFTFVGGIILSCLLYPQHIQYIWQSILMIIPLAIIIFSMFYICIKNISIEEAIKC